MKKFEFLFIPSKTVEVLTLAEKEHFSNDGNRAFLVG
jgi:hypothetical protein